MIVEEGNPNIITISRDHAYGSDIRTQSALLRALRDAAQTFRDIIERNRYFIDIINDSYVQVANCQDLNIPLFQPFN